ncbi:MAG: pseudaminic acid biosynthesis-associated methylase [Candidatus Latescibacterota bacterium]|nr:pseudaminic acid biosynthesis-associated methylase [Candidatus Latescibacterota bacterium]
MPEAIIEAQRLEALWQGEFGHEYTRRNTPAKLKKIGIHVDGRGQFWSSVLSHYDIAGVLEVGCNRGVNLRFLAELVDPSEVYGIDINPSALDEVRSRFPGVTAIQSPARVLPFPDRRFDLVFTSGVLIHQPPESIGQVLSEIVRTSKKYVLCCEYFADEVEVVAYRNQDRALFKQNYGALYQANFPGLRLIEKGFLGPEEGWDNFTYWLFEKD